MIHLPPIDTFKANCKREIIRLALNEDIYSGDLTTLATIPETKNLQALLKSKSRGIVSGIETAGLILKEAKSGLRLNALKSDGDRVFPGDCIFELSGRAWEILTYERTILNFMQRMSGIATATNTFVKEVEHTSAKIVDTRKTAPGLRFFDKEAVLHGGGANHRIGLFDMILIKDNHIDAAGSIRNAIQLAKSYLSDHQNDTKIEVEVRTLNELALAIDEKPDIILLDNFNLDDLKRGVEMVKQKSAIKTEASGGVDIKTVRKIAETGVDFISVGALTHSVKALDISLVIQNTNES